MSNDDIARSSQMHGSEREIVPHNASKGSCNMTLRQLKYLLHVDRCNGDTLEAEAGSVALHTMAGAPLVENIGSTLTQQWQA